MTLGFVLRRVLKKHPKTAVKTTYSTLATHLGVTNQAVSLWANGKTLPDTKHIAPIAEYFGITCDELLGHGESEIFKQTTTEDFAAWLRIKLSHFDEVILVHDETIDAIGKGSEDMIFSDDGTIATAIYKVREDNAIFRIQITKENGNATQKLRRNAQ